MLHLKVNVPFDLGPRLLLEKVTNSTGGIKGAGCNTTDEEIQSHWPLLYRHFQSELVQLLNKAERIAPTFAAFGERSCHHTGKQRLEFVTRVSCAHCETGGRRRACHATN